MSQIYNAYLEAKVDYEILEQQVRQCQDPALLPGMNHLLQQSAIAVNRLFWDWNDEVDELLSLPAVPEIPVTRQVVVAGWWQGEDINQTPGAA